MEKLRTYLNSLSQDEQKQFADKCFTSIGYLRKAISQNQLINPITCVRIEVASLQNISRQDLRPLDWHLVWPELSELAA
jgi:DNA-binding transcriptional regulator YdaS (Cro superfamily)